MVPRNKTFSSILTHIFVFVRYLLRYVCIVIITFTWFVFYCMCVRVFFFVGRKADDDDN